MAKCLLDELMGGLIAATEQELGPSENEKGRKMDQGLQSTQVISIFDLIYF